ncbi:hypothetical protein [Sinorhizobium meliloti]|uniref:Uncharacterized protein n=1 Tax=Rhizobium meliloti TaxID=382 RepID=A0A2J0YSX3_RHIML|nr:hypothetical protein [Sinorhizobium meliloti]PJR06832.1 hypothetical protein CEJ86_33620 [Sinorhizobium meliloti]
MHRKSQDPSSDEDLEMLFQFMECFDDPDLPDGAWEMYLKEGIKQYNHLFNTDHEKHQAWLGYMQWKQDK